MPLQYRLIVIACHSLLDHSPRGMYLAREKVLGKSVVLHMFYYYRF